MLPLIDSSYHMSICTRQETGWKEIEETTYRNEALDNLPPGRELVWKCTNCNLVISHDEALPEYCPGCHVCQDEIEVMVVLN